MSQLDQSMEVLGFQVLKHYIKTLRRLISHICDISPLRGSECVPSITKNTCNWCQAQANENG